MLFSLKVVTLINRSAYFLKKTTQNDNPLHDLIFEPNTLKV